MRSSGAGPRHPLTWAAACTGLTAIGGGVGLMIKGIGMTDEMLPRLPGVHSWRLPGVALIAIVGVPQTAAAVAEWRRSPSAPRITATAGALLIGMELAELALIPFSWMQPAFLTVGAAEVAALAAREGSG